MKKLFSLRNTIFILAGLLLLMVIAKKTGLIGSDKNTKVTAEEVIKRTIIETVSGSGKIESFGMHADNSDIIISSSGRCETTALSNLDVSISGSGSVWFRGNPRISQRISGSGKIFNAN
jgi:hypothetical protein